MAGSSFCQINGNELCLPMSRLACSWHAAWCSTCRACVRQAGTLLTFLALEAPSLRVTPEQRYAAAIAARHSAAAGALRAAALKT